MTFPLAYLPPKRAKIHQNVNGVSERQTRVPAVDRKQLCLLQLLVVLARVYPVNMYAYDRIIKPSHSVLLAIFGKTKKHQSVRIMFSKCQKDLLVGVIATTFFI